jgi:hypothetical protein
MKNLKSPYYEALIAFRAHSADKAELAEVSRLWQLDESEIARRALRTGLDVLRNFKVPGVLREKADG